MIAKTALHGFVIRCKGSGMFKAGSAHQTCRIWCPPVRPLDDEAMTLHPGIGLRIGPDSGVDGRRSATCETMFITVFVHGGACHGRSTPTGPYGDTEGSPAGAAPPHAHSAATGRLMGRIPSGGMNLPAEEVLGEWASGSNARGRGGNRRREPHRPRRHAARVSTLRRSYS